MFWSETELQELQASYVTGASRYLTFASTLLTFSLGKIGREEAERTYREHLAPAIQVRSSVASEHSPQLKLF